MFLDLLFSRYRLFPKPRDGLGLWQCWCSMAIGVGIGNVDAAECLASDYTRALGGWPVDRFKQRVVLVGLAVRPTVDCNRLNVVSGIETSRKKYPGQADHERCARRH